MRTRIGILLLVMVLGVSGNVWLDEWAEHVGREASPETLEQNMGLGAPDQSENYPGGPCFMNVPTRIDCR